MLQIQLKNILYRKYCALSSKLLVKSKDLLEYTDCVVRLSVSNQLSIMSVTKVDNQMNILQDL